MLCAERIQSFDLTSIQEVYYELLLTFPGRLRSVSRGQSVDVGTHRKQDVAVHRLQDLYELPVIPRLSGKKDIQGYEDTNLGLAAISGISANERRKKMRRF